MRRYLVQSFGVLFVLLTALGLASCDFLDDFVEGYHYGKHYYDDAQAPSKERIELQMDMPSVTTRLAANQLDASRCAFPSVQVASAAMRSQEAGDFVGVWSCTTSTAWQRIELTVKRDGSASMVKTKRAGMKITNSSSWRWSVAQRHGKEIITLTRGTSENEGFLDNGRLILDVGDETLLFELQ